MFILTTYLYATTRVIQVNTHLIAQINIGSGGWYQPV